MRTFLQQFNSREFFGLIHLHLFGTYDGSQDSHLAVFEKSADLKEKLKAVDGSYPSLPSRLSVYQFDCGVVFVTQHAWDRFWQRFLNQEISVTRAVARLKDSFERAVIDSDYKESVVRLINNKFVPAFYLFDASLKIRFVVNKKTKRLVTVENF